MAEKDIDMKWVENEIDNIKIKLEKPREQILDLTEKACHKGGRGQPLSPVSPLVPACDMGGSFLDDNTLDGTGTITTAEGKTLTVSTGDLDDETMASTLMMAETPLKSKHQSRFAPVLEDAKKREKAAAEAKVARAAAGGADIVIGLCLSRKHSTLGHPGSVTRQTAFDFNELQDRDYKYVSSTDDSGWLAGGGERGDPYLNGVPREFDHSGSIISKSEDSDGLKVKSFGAGHKIAAPDRVHIPIIQINAPSSAAIDEIISALARGEIFIPEVSILPETLSVNTTSPPDLQVRFGCEKNDDTNPEDWPNWCLEFLHNQLYDYFAPVGAQWSKRPFQITLARKVRWMTIKHMNKYFARSEQVIHSWREKGPQYLQPPYSDDSSRGVILEEITRPHGIYLIQNGAPTNYFSPNFQPPYTTKMRRSLIRNVINKSWDSKHRDWLAEPVPRMRGPVQLISSVMGCNNPGHLSPVEETALASNFGDFHMRPDFDFVHENRDLGAKTPTQEEVRSRKSDRKNNEAYYSGKQQQKDSQRRRPEEREEELDTRPTTSSIPSDESYGTSTRPSGTLSLSLEETMTDPANDTITADRTNSNSVESPGRAKQWSGELSPDKESQDDVERKQFFNGGSRGRTSSFGSSKGFSESSPAESERETKFDPEQQRQISIESPKVDALEQPLKEPQHKVDDRRAEKFARTKSKRREMRDRRQDESGERSTPTSKASPSPTRRSNQSPVSPSCESMAYSLDSASQFRPPVASNSTNDGGSVFTVGTENQSLLSYVTRSTMVHSRYQEDEENHANIDDEEGDDISLSLLESKSSIVPNDEELKAVGWAKALDPHSGSYYYFTLDRTTTVWENPLATSP